MTATLKLGKNPIPRRPHTSLVASKIRIECPRLPSETAVERPAIPKRRQGLSQRAVWLSSTGIHTASAFNQKMARKLDGMRFKSYLPNDQNPERNETAIQPSF
jgi:hypothetical protein